MSPLRQHPSIQNYLNRATHKIKNKKTKTETIEELFSHIESEVLKLTLQGLSRDQSIEQALLHLGPADQLSDDFSKLHRQILNTFRLYLFSAIAISCFLLIYFTTSAFKEEYTAQNQYVSSAFNYWDTYVLDINLIQTSSIFKNLEAQKDAGVLFNRFLKWPENILETYRHLTKNDNLKNIDLDVSWAKNKDLDDLNRADQEKYNALDLSWMSELLTYDYWDLYQYGPASHPTISSTPFWNGRIYDLPKPWLSDFLTLSRIRLKKGLQSNTVHKAIQEVHHLAQLLYSTETLEGARMALDIMNEERIFSEQENLISQKLRLNLPHFSEELINKTKYAIEATEVFTNFNLLENNVVFQKVSQHLLTLPGVCAAYSQSMNISLIRNQPLSNLSKDSNQNLTFEKLAKKCRFTKLKRNETLKEWAATLYKIEEQKYKFTNNLLDFNISTHLQLFFLKWALRTPFVASIYTNYIASTEKPIFPTAYYQQRLQFTGH